MFFNGPRQFSFTCLCLTVESGIVDSEGLGGCLGGEGGTGEGGGLFRGFAGLDLGLFREDVVIEMRVVLH